MGRKKTTTKKATPKRKKSKTQVESSDDDEDDRFDDEDSFPSPTLEHIRSTSHHGSNIVHVSQPPQRLIANQGYQLPEEDEEDSLFDEDPDTDFETAAANARYAKEQRSLQNNNETRGAPFAFPTLDDSSDRNFMDQLDAFSSSFVNHPANAQPQARSNPNMLLHMPNLMLPNFTLPTLSHGPNLHAPHPMHHLPHPYTPHPAHGISPGNLHPPTVVDHPHHHEDSDENDGHKLHANVEDQPDDVVRPLISVNLFRKAFQRSNLNIIPSLSKPSFCPFRTDLFVCGTEEQDPAKRHQNSLIFASIDDQTVNPRFTYNLADHIRDVQWIDAQFIVFGVNQKLGLVRMSVTDLAIDDVVMFPEFHKDTIREICVSDGNKNLVISGGFDGNVFVTDISRLCSDIQKNEKKSENSLYPCKDVVGSVNWHPRDHHLASCTTDTGILHIFDIRTDRRRPAIVYDTLRKELYTHGYKDENNLLLGYGDSSIMQFDIRIKRSLATFQDPNHKQIGEIRFDHNTKNFVAFGVPNLTVWQYDDASVNLIGTKYMQQDPSIYDSGNYKTSGEFRRGTSTFGATDSCGIFTVYGVQRK